MKHFTVLTVFSSVNIDSKSLILFLLLHVRCSLQTDHINVCNDARRKLNMLCFARSSP